MFLDPLQVPSDKFDSFKATLETIIQRAFQQARDGKSVRIKLDRSHVELLASLPVDCESEDLEDWLHLVIEAYHLSGVHVAADEIDFDQVKELDCEILDSANINAQQVACDVRVALEEVSDAADTKVASDSHLVLILDKVLQKLPWESLPCIRGRSTSRLPSLSFLLDRLDYDTIWPTSPQSGLVSANPSKTFFVLNPGSDLHRTHSRFEEWLLAKQQHGWQGIIDRAPVEEELKCALSSTDVFLCVPSMTFP